MSTDEHYTVGKTTLTMPTIFEDKLLKKEIAELQRAKEELLGVLVECMGEIKKSFPNVYEAEMIGMSKTFISRALAAIEAHK